MTPDSGLTDLINDARASAVRRVQDEGRAGGTPDDLVLLARYVRLALLQQVATGKWAVYNVTQVGQLFDVVVTARLNTGLVGPPILVEFDFRRTALRMLQVDNRQIQ